MLPQQPTIVSIARSAIRWLTERSKEKEMCSCFQIQQEKGNNDADDRKVVSIIMQITVAYCLDVFKCLWNEMMNNVYIYEYIF